MEGGVGPQKTGGIKDLVLNQAMQNKGEGVQRGQQDDGVSVRLGIVARSRQVPNAVTLPRVPPNTAPICVGCEPCT